MSLLHMSETQSSELRYGAIEAGGTKVVCAIGDGQARILDETRIETRDPETTLAAVLDYFRRAEAAVGDVQAFGVGSFGPVEVNADSPRFGFIGQTPKPGWSNTDLLGSLRRGLRRPMALDTDVNAAAIGEWRWGAGRNLDSVAYVTVGTGIGGGALHYGRPIHGLMHPEVGHIRVQRHGADADFTGICPFHGDCLEGLMSGPAIVARTGRTLVRAESADVIWDIAADYLGQLCALLVLTHSPQRIVLGGGVMQQRLLAAIQTRMLHWLHGYPALDALARVDYLMLPALGERAGVKGALAMAMAMAKPGA